MPEPSCPFRSTSFVRDWSWVSCLLFAGRRDVPGVENCGSSVFEWQRHFWRQQPALIPETLDKSHCLHTPGMKKQVWVFDKRNNKLLSLYTQFFKTKVNLLQNRHCRRRGQQWQPHLYFFRRLFFLGSWFSSGCSAVVDWREERVWMCFCVSTLMNVYFKKADWQNRI